MAQEGGFGNRLIGFSLMALFGVLILSSVVLIGNTYEKDTSEIVGGATSLERFQKNVDNIEGDAQKLEDRFRTGSIWSVIAGIVVEGVFGIALTMIDMIFAPFFLMTGIMQDRFGVPAYVTGVLMGLLIFAIIFEIWRLLKIGS